MKLLERGEEFKTEDIVGGDQQHNFFVTSELIAKLLIIFKYLIVPCEQAFYGGGDTEFGELSGSQSGHRNRH